MRIAQIGIPMDGMSGDRSRMDTCVAQVKRLVEIFQDHRVALAISCLFISFGAAAAIPAGIRLSSAHYEYFKAQGGDSFALWVKGVGAGIEAANAWLIANHRAPLFCPPPALALTHDNFLQILDEQMKLTPSGVDWPLDVVLVNGMIRAFPCKQ